MDFLDVKEDGQMGNVQSLNNFYAAVKDTSECGLPNVSWITPNEKVSEHPPALVSIRSGVCDDVDQFDHEEPLLG